MDLNLNNVKSRLERLTCSSHLKHPTISFNGSNLKFECWAMRNLKCWAFRCSFREAWSSQTHLLYYCIHIFLTYTPSRFLCCRHTVTSRISIHVSSAGCRSSPIPYTWTFHLYSISSTSLYPLRCRQMLICHILVWPSCVNWRTLWGQDQEVQVAGGIHRGVLSNAVGTLPETQGMHAPALFYV